MKHSLLAVLLAAPVQAAGTFQLPPIAPVKLPAHFGQAPLTTAIPTAETLDTFHLTDHIVSLGGKDWRMAIQTTRDDSWAVSLLEVGKRHREFSWSTTYRALERGLRVDRIGDTDYRSTLENGLVTFTPEQGPVVTADPAALKAAVYAKAVPVPSMGPEWRMIFQADLWVGAGMRTFSFLRDSGAGIEFHNVRSESVDFGKERVKEVAGRKIGLQMVEGSLVIRPIP